MKNAVIGLIVIIIVIGGGAWLWHSHKKSSNNASNSSSSSTTSTTSSASSSSTTAQQTNKVTISNFAFSPATISVKTGSTVTWTNQDSVSHTITSDSGTELNSSTIAQGSSYSHTFNTAGTFTYHCSIHPEMKATVEVTN